MKTTNPRELTVTSTATDDRETHVELPRHGRKLRDGKITMPINVRISADAMMELVRLTDGAERPKTHIIGEMLEAGIRVYSGTEMQDDEDAGKVEV